LNEEEKDPKAPHSPYKKVYYENGKVRVAPNETHEEKRQ
jgi:hypothetical protein